MLRCAECVEFGEVKKEYEKEFDVTAANSKSRT